MIKSKLTKQDVKDALINARISVKVLQNSTNPQSQEICFKTQGQVEAFEAVLYAMYGEPAFMYIYSRKIDYSKK